MNISMGMALSLLSTLGARVGMSGIAMVAYVKGLAKSTYSMHSTHSERDADGKINHAIAGYYKNKYRAQAAVSGHYQAAKNLRKQGVPLEMARMILFGYE